MKTCSTALKSFLASLMAQPDAVVFDAECLTFSLTAGITLRYTTADVDIAYGGHVFSSGGPIINGLKYHSTIGLNVDEQQIEISARPDVTVAGAPFMIALGNGAFELCGFQRDRVFFADRIGGTLVGGVTLFHGRFVSIDECGRNKATVTIADDLVQLANQMPRNSWSPTCNHTLYDAGCGVDRSAYATTLAVATGSTDRTLLTTAATFNHVGGYVQFTSGPNAGLQRTVKNVTVGANLTLSFPLPQAPNAGDAFTLYAGCDHTIATCRSVFSNDIHFRGFPWVPPPQFAQ